ncbi:MAG TPA: ribonucleotide-diphosphate reductase subunit beta [Chloroflexia bacterium]|nr:ribonucleotide-diphosphate reductase subunit beta [Chloroflexia bacterium]
MVNTLNESEQIDPASVADANLDRVEPVGPRRLYFMWESRHWASGSFDFERDRRDWAQMQEDQRSMLIQSIAPFFVGEERVAAAFAPIIMSADDEQEAAFLATQQVDEARHMQFFDRFWREVLMPDVKASSEAIANARSRCNDAFTELFDRRLMQAVDRLRADPRDTDAKVEAVTIYHLIIEGTMGLTGMHFLLDYFEKNSLFPDITEGFRNIKRDEHRHVAWGTWYLRRKCRERDRYGLIVQSALMELLPVVASVLVEGGVAACDGLDPVEFLDYPSAAVNHYALLGLSRRLKVIGGATDEIQQFVSSTVWRAARYL